MVDINQIEADVAAIAATEASISSTKLALTGILNNYIAQFNANGSRYTMAVTLTSYVNQFNMLTALDHTLIGQVAKLHADSATASMVAAGLVAQAGATSPVLTVPVAVPIVTTGFVAAKGDATHPTLTLK